MKSNTPSALALNVESLNSEKLYDCVMCKLNSVPHSVGEKEYVSFLLNVPSDFYKIKKDMKFVIMKVLGCYYVCLKYDEEFGVYVSIYLEKKQLTYIQFFEMRYYLHDSFFDKWNHFLIEFNDSGLINTDSDPVVYYNGVGCYNQDNIYFPIFLDYAMYDTLLIGIDSPVPLSDSENDKLECGSFYISHVVQFRALPLPYNIIKEIYNNGKYSLKIYSYYSDIMMLKTRFMNSFDSFSTPGSIVMEDLYYSVGKAEYKITSTSPRARQNIPFSLLGISDFDKELKRTRINNGFVSSGIGGIDVQNMWIRNLQKKDSYYPDLDGLEKKRDYCPKVFLGTKNYYHYSEVDYSLDISSSFVEVEHEYRILEYEKSVSFFMFGEAGFYITGSSFQTPDVVSKSIVMFFKYGGYFLEDGDGDYSGSSQYFTGLLSSPPINPDIDAASAECEIFVDVLNGKSKRIKMKYTIPSFIQENNTLYGKSYIKLYYFYIGG